MNLWLSAEVDGTVSEDLRAAENKVERILLPRLRENYGSAVERWSLITILRETIPDGWGEVKKYHPKTRVVEFRLIIDFESFQRATPQEQAKMLVASILRSTELFPALKVEGFDVDRFRRDITDAATTAGLLNAKTL